MKILAVFAHPDDEAFGPAGTLSRYSLTGHAVHLVTMTQGEAGTLGPARRLTRVELGRLRATELRCSAKALHVTSLDVRQFQDGRLAELPAEEALGILRQKIDTLSPDILISFHSSGISGHPDHQTVARWCLQLVQERAKPPRLFSYGISEAQAERIKHRRIFPIPEDEITHVVDVARFLEYKLDAIRCHQSQKESWEKMKQVEGGIESYLRKEHFSQVWPAPKQGARLERLED
jgi:LmbE family N-acetylglucosaminyl deacetylase